MTETKLTALKKLAVNLGVDATAAERCVTNSDALNLISQHLGDEGFVSAKEIGDLSTVAKSSTKLNDYGIFAIAEGSENVTNIGTAFPLSIAGYDFIKFKVTTLAGEGGAVKIGLCKSDGVWVCSTETFNTDDGEMEGIFDVSNINTDTEDYYFAFNGTSETRIVMQLTDIYQCTKFSDSEFTVVDVLNYLLSNGG